MTKSAERQAEEHVNNSEALPSCCSETLVERMNAERRKSFLAGYAAGKAEGWQTFADNPPLNDGERGIIATDGKNFILSCDDAEIWDSNGDGTWTSDFSTLRAKYWIYLPITPKWGP